MEYLAQSQVYILTLISNPAVITKIIYEEDLDEASCGMSTDTDKVQAGCGGERH
jgi:hypothetical protein